MVFISSYADFAHQPQELVSLRGQMPLIWSSVVAALTSVQTGSLHLHKVLVCTHPGHFRLQYYYINLL